MRLNSSKVRWTSKNFTQDESQIPALFKKTFHKNSFFCNLNRLSQTRINSKVLLTLNKPNKLIQCFIVNFENMFFTQPLYLMRFTFANCIYKNKISTSWILVNHPIQVSVVSFIFH